MIGILAEEMGSTQLVAEQRSIKESRGRNILPYAREIAAPIYKYVGVFVIGLQVHLRALYLSSTLETRVFCMRRESGVLR